MTKKQFEWLRYNQPIEDPRWIEVYKEHAEKEKYVNHLTKVEILGDCFIVYGISHRYNMESRKWEQKHTKYEINYRYVKCLRYNRSRRKR
jgi:superfamily I DNA/RNA helicase